MKKTKIILIILAAALLSALTAFAVSSANDVMMTFDKGTEDTVTNMPQDEALTLEYVVPDNVPEREGYKFLYWTLDYGAKTSYTVRYVLEGTDDDIADPKVVPEAYAFTNVTEAAAAFDGYDFASDPEQSVVLDPDSGKNVITFYYKKHVVSTSYTIVCYDDRGEVIYSDSFEGYSGERVAISAPVLEHYELSAGSPYSVDIELSEYEDENVFVFTYDTQMIMYTIRYVWWGEEVDIVEPENKIVPYNTVVTESYADLRNMGYNLESSSRRRQSKTIDNEGIEIVFYYYRLE